MFVCLIVRLRAMQLQRTAMDGIRSRRISSDNAKRRRHIGIQPDVRNHHYPTGWLRIQRLEPQRPTGRV